MVQNRNSQDYIERIGIDPSKVRNVALPEITGHPVQGGELGGGRDQIMSQVHCRDGRPMLSQPNR